jgi:hypothetical protein
MSRKRLSRGDGLIYEDTAMPDQFLPDAFQSQDSSGIWGFDPVLLMILSFTVVPIALAILVLTLGALGRLLRGDGPCQSTTRPAENRFKVVRPPQTTARLETRRWMAPPLKVNRVWQFRGRHRRGARHPREWRLRRREGPR